MQNRLKTGKSETEEKHTEKVKTDKIAEIIAKKKEKKIRLSRKKTVRRFSEGR